ncbi:MAG: HAD family phosphatase [Solobacterium sp.]|nr:HAD family phosphatase [Solobacterium sp.]
MILFACDYDNTLYYPDDGIRKADADALSNFTERGGLFAIATGRSLKSVRVSAAPYNLPVHWWICSNGAAVFKETELLYLNPIPQSAVHEILRYGEEFGVSLFEFGNGYDSFELEADRSESLLLQACRMCKEKLSEGKTDELVQIGFAFRNEEELNGCKIQLEKIAGLRLHMNASFIDITSATASKENALAFLSSFSGIQDIRTAGDDLNDLGMLKNYSGFLMNHASESLKSCYKKTASSAAECLSLIYMEQDAQLRL